MKKSNPIRMCITCRNRYPQSSLIRLQEKAKIVMSYTGIGRSFYLCKDCINNEKKIKGLIKRFNQDRERFIKLLKELMNNG